MSDILDDLYPDLNRYDGRLRFTWGYKCGWKWVPRFLQRPLVSGFNRVACFIGEHDDILFLMAKKGLVPVEDSRCTSCCKEFRLSEAEAEQSRQGYKEHLERLAKLRND